VIPFKKSGFRSFNNIPYYLSLSFIFICVFISIFSFFIIPDKSANANSMNLNIQSMKPGFTVKILSLPSSEKRNLKSYFFGLEKPIVQYAINDYRFSNDSIIFSIYNKFNEFEEIKSLPLLMFNQEDNNVQNNVHNIQDIISNDYINEKIFLFGTDLYGRDLFSRVLLGTRVSLSIGIMAVLISTFIGLLFGSIGGYFGGVLDKIIVYVINVFWSIPTLLLVIAISLSLGKGFWQVYIAIGFSVWVDVARLVRGKVISEKNKDYISASKILGFNNIYIIVYHLLPNIIGPILIIAAANFASSILLESGLSFLGIGTQPPLPSWGYMIKENYQYIILGNAYLALIPALCLVFLVSSFMFLSNYYSDKKV
jgi:peptide/nickel transport system permease protein